MLSMKTGKVSPPDECSPVCRQPLINSEPGLPMDELDILRTATMLIKALGITAAASDAGRRAMHLRKKGDAIGAEVWKRIESAIEKLERTSYVPDTSRH